MIDFRVEYGRVFFLFRALNMTPLNSLVAIYMYLAYGMR